MAFHGDFRSFPLPELLQWIDSSRKTGTLLVRWSGAERKLFMREGRVFGTGTPGMWERLARMLSSARLAKGEDVLAAFREMARTQDAQRAFATRQLDFEQARTLASDELYAIIADLTGANEGEFHWTEDLDQSDDEWIAQDISLRQLLFEALRWVDEQADVDRALPSDSVVVRARTRPMSDHSVLFRVILTLSEPGISLGKLRLALGVSRSAATRRVFDLMRQEMVTVDGARDVEPDPVSEMLEKGSLLVREGQFEAASLVFSSLLASDPTDRRVREFARMVEREHIASFYADFPPLLVPTVVNDAQALALIRPEERKLASIINGTWDISTIVLASPMRELDTLKTLSKLQRLGLLSLKA